MTSAYDTAADAYDALSPDATDEVIAEVTADFLLVMYGKT